MFGIRYALGDAHLESYQLNGTPVGTLTEPENGEYRLYDRCVALHKESGVASPSGWLELLRFGRKIGADAFPDTAPHWRRVKLPGNVNGWMDLNTTNTKKYSDADFPHFMGWRLVDDDSTDDNSRCQSAAIERFLNITPEGDPLEADTPAMRMQRLCATDVQRKLAKTICKFPSEWVADDVEKRWKWITEPGNPYNLVPTDTKGFEDVKAYAKALCFWAELPKEDKDRLTTKHWHFHPREFIIHMRKSGWLSTKEMYQLFPTSAMRLASSGWVSENVSISQDRVNTYRFVLNRVCSKYCVTTPQRMATFYANAMQETMWFNSLRENNTAARYYPWDGRGFLQLTWPNNYVKYFRFVGKTISTADASSLLTAQQTSDHQHSNAALANAEVRLPEEVKRWRREVAEILRASAESAGAYWAWSMAARQADASSANLRETKRVNGNQVVYYINSSMGNVAATVNIGHASTNYASVNGIVARFQAYIACQMVLLDAPMFPDPQGTMKSFPENYVQRRP